MVSTEKPSKALLVWDFLTRPSPRVAPLRRARSRTLAILVVITLPVLWLISSWAWPDSALQALRLLTPIAFILIYFANRLGYFHGAAWGFVVVLALQPALYLVALPVSTFETITFGAIWLIAPILVCYVLLSVRELVLTLLLVFSLIIGILLLNSAISFSELSISLLILFWVSVVLLVSSVARRDDVRRQVAHADRLTESESRYRTLFAAAMDGIVVHQNGVVVDCNQAFAQLVGYRQDEIIGMQALAFFAPEERDRAQQLMASTETYQAQGMRKDGSRFWASVQGRPIQVNGQPMRIATLTDITQRKEAEKQIVRLSVEQEKVTVLQRFISNLSHDLRTPLSTINTGLYLIRKVKDDPVRLDTHINRVQEQVTHLESMIDDMLVMSTLDRRATGEYKFAWRDVNPVVERAVEEEMSQALRKRQSLSFTGATDLPEALLDAGEFKRLMKHLIQNAINFTPEGGTITVRTARDEEEIVVRVRDTGIGISAQERDRIFDYFYRADESRSPDTGGTGLGLTIAQRISDAHNGRIEVESTPGQGSTFTVRLPVTRNVARTIADSI